MLHTVQSANKGTSPDKNFNWRDKISKVYNLVAREWEKFSSAPDFWAAGKEEEGEEEGSLLKAPQNLKLIYGFCCLNLHGGEKLFIVESKTVKGCQRFKVK